MVKKFFESFDEIFSLPSSKKILVDDAYLYNALHYKWNMGLNIIIKIDNSSLFEKLNKLMYCPLRYDRFKTEFTVSELKYLNKFLNFEFVSTCFTKTDSDILREEKKQMCSKSKIFKKFQSILYKYENLEFSKKNEQSLADEIKNICLQLSK